MDAMSLELGPEDELEIEERILPSCDPWSPSVATQETGDKGRAYRGCFQVALVKVLPCNKPRKGTAQEGRYSLPIPREKQALPIF